MKKIIFLIICFFVCMQIEAQVSKTINCTAGNLSSLLTEDEKSTITDLTLTGSTDARDFKTMRDDMPLLAKIDMTEANILGYSGTMGTGFASGGFDMYSENTIPQYAFNNYNAHKSKTTLTTFILPESATSIEYSAFNGCIGLTTVKFSSSLISIDTYAFRYCTSLTSLSFPEGLMYIMTNSFENCASVSTITIPSKVSFIGVGAFVNNPGSINVDINNQDYSSIDGVLFDKKQTLLIQCPTSKTENYTIPSTVTSIGQMAFASCQQLTTMIIPPSIISIEDRAFQFCRGLTTLSIPSSVIYMGPYSFQFCNNLNLIYVYSPSPINLISSRSVFYGINKTCTLNVPLGSEKAYQTADQWNVFTNVNKMAGLYLSTNTLGLSPDIDTTTLSLVTSEAFTASSDQPWLTINPTSGHGGADTISLTATSNPNTNKRTATVTITATGLPSQTVTVTQYGITEVTAGNLKMLLGDQLTSISNLTLTGTIDARDFKTMRDDMPLLSEIDLSGTTIVAYSGTEGTYPWGQYTYDANNIPFNAFFSQSSGQGNISLTSFIFPSLVTSIGDNSFIRCKRLKSVIIPSTINLFKSFVFEDCCGLETIYLYSVKPPLTYSLVFWNVNTAACKLYVPFGSLSAYANAEVWKNFEIIEMPGFTLSDTMATLDAIDGSSGSVFISSSTNWQANSDQTWLKVSPASGTGNGAITFTAEANTTTSTRIAKVTVSGSGVTSQTVMVTQSAGEAALAVSPLTIEIAATEGDTTITITSNASWTVAHDQSWLTVVPSSGSGNATVTLTSEANPSSSARTATLTVSATGAASQTVLVTQPGTVGVLDRGMANVRVYPNPFTDCFYVSTNSPETVVSLFSISGKLLFSYLVTGNQFIPANVLKQGIYFVELKTAVNVSRLKVLKQ